MATIYIRDVDEEIAHKLNIKAVKARMNRSELLRSVLRQVAEAPEDEEIDVSLARPA